jgi:hypothetical protein
MDFTEQPNSPVTSPFLNFPLLPFANDDTEDTFSSSLSVVFETTNETGVPPCFGIATSEEMLEPISDSVVRDPHFQQYSQISQPQFSQHLSGQEGGQCSPHQMGIEEPLQPQILSTEETEPKELNNQNKPDVVIIFIFIIYFFIY